MKPYPAYRDSGVPWLGGVPAHWEISAVGRHFSVDLGKMLNQAKQDGTGTKKRYLRAANIHWDRLVLSDVNEMEFSDQQLERYRLRRGDLLVTEGGVTVGRSAIWNDELEECFYQNSLNRARLLQKSPLSTRFLLYWMHFTTMNGYVDLVADKATFGHLTNEKLKAFPLVVPPDPSERRAIVSYLDHKTAQIDAVITRKERLIELLREERTAFISHAVTKGLNPDAPMKDSGVPWLGEVPAHWEISAVRRHFAVDLGKMLNQAKQDGTGVVKPYLRAANIHWDRLDLLDVNEMEFSDQQLERYRLQRGDLLVTEGGVTVGRSAIWNDELDECYYQNSLNRARPLQESPLSTRFLLFWMQFTTMNGYVDLVANKATFGHLTNEKLKAFPLVVPPEPSEQRAIVTYVDQKTIDIDQTIARTEAQIERLREYRTALISAVVTGKVDVREEAAS